jgi:hypothetical protein
MGRGICERLARQLACTRSRRSSQPLQRECDLPFSLISRVLGEDKAFVTGVAELRAYWRKALDANKELHFEINHVLVGSDAITISYRNHRGQEVAETLVFDAQRQIIEGIVTYK